MIASHTESTFSTQRRAQTGASARRLSAQGAACIDRWVVANASQLAGQSLAAWHQYAESVASSTPVGGAVVIEMHMSTTKSGYPEELRCAQEWFVPA